MVVAVFATVALPGADTNATFTNERWAYIIGTGVAASIFLVGARGAAR